MLVGVPKEIKNHESRVGMVPACVDELINNGHRVMIEANAGKGIGINDADYQAPAVAAALKLQCVEPLVA